MKAGWQTKTLGEVCFMDKSQDIHKNLPYVGLEHIEARTGRFIGSTEPVKVKVKEGVDELDQEKLSPLLKLKYHTLPDATKSLGTTEQIRGVFVGFQRYLYEQARTI
jgi:hypothetical protein